MNKSKTLLCSFSKETMPIIRYQHLLKNYEIHKVLTPKSYLSQDQDFSCIDGGITLNLKPVNEYGDLTNIETILMDDSERIPENYINGLMEKLSAYNKEIICFNNNSLLLDNNDMFVENECKGFNKLHSITIPVISVMGLGDNCNKFEIQLALRDYYQNNGYKVCQIGTKQYSSLFGFQSIPEFIYNPNLSLERKIYMFNHYVHNLIEEEKPDLLIMGIPGAIMKFNDDITNHFGESAFVMNNAVLPDISILSVYYGELNLTQLNKLKDYCRYKLDCDVDYINIANNKIEIKNENYKNPIEYLTFGSEEILSFINEIKNDEFYLFNVLGEGTNYNFCKDIETNLENNTVFV